MLRVVRVAHGFALFCPFVFAAASNACRIAAGHRAHILLATHGVQIGPACLNQAFRQPGPLAPFEGRG